MTAASSLALRESLWSTLTSREPAPAWLVLVALAFFLPGFFSLPPMDRDEARFAQASKQMIETGDFVGIRFQDEARNKKPVGIYWAQAAVVGAARGLGVPNALTTIWLYRIPSMLSAIGAILLTFWTGTAFLSRRGAAMAGALFGSTVLIGVEARLATTDAAVAATVVACMGALARAYLASRDPQRSAARPWAPVLIFWVAIGLGVLVKGPITPMVPALAALALSVKDRSARWLLALRPLAGVFLVVLIAAPWLIAITVRTHGAFLSDSLGGDMLAKVGGAKESHGAPPGTYFAVFWLTAWPMAPFAAVAAPFAWRQRATPAVAFLLAWLVPAWLVFEAAPTKLPHYVMPLYPAIALLIAVAVERGESLLARPWRRWVMGLVPLIAAVLLGAALAFLIWRRVLPGWPGQIAAPLAVWAIWIFFRSWSGKDAFGTMASAIGLAGLTYVAVYGGLLTAPIVDSIDISTQLAAVRETEATRTGCPDLAAVTTNYREPSLVFLTGTDLREDNPDGAAAFLAQAPCRIAFVLLRDQKAFGAALGSRAGAPLFQRVYGFNLGHGQEQAINVWTRGK